MIRLISVSFQILWQLPKARSTPTRIFVNTHWLIYAVLLLIPSMSLLPVGVAWVPCLVSRPHCHASLHQSLLTWTRASSSSLAVLLYIFHNCVWFGLYWCHMNHLAWFAAAVTCLIKIWLDMGFRFDFIDYLRGMLEHVFA